MLNYWQLLVSIGLLLGGARAQWNFQPPKSEGEECGYVGDVIWTCQKQSDCDVTSSLVFNGRRVTCSIEGGSPIICCPQKSVANRITGTVSERKCLEYQQNICNNNPVLLEGTPFPGVELDKNTDFKVINNTEETPDVGIFGGRQAFPKEFPHAALIGYGEENKVSWKCGGTLISERFVLSAAHCTSSESGFPRWVRLGDLDYRNESDDARPQQFEIIEQIVHEKYTSPLYYNDIVLFRLDRDVVFDDYVAPACLYSALETPVGIATATGYGKVETHLTTSHLMRVDLNFIADENCKTNLIDKESLPTGVDSETMFCAFGSGKDTCPGDSGGSLTLANRGDNCLAQLVGITSFGLSICDVHQTPAAYVRVARFIPWIESIVWPDDKSTQ